MWSEIFWNTADWKSIHLFSWTISKFIYLTCSCFPSEAAFESRHPSGSSVRHSHRPLCRHSQNDEDHATHQSAQPRLELITCSLLVEKLSDIIAISGDLADGFVRDFGKAAQPLCNLTARYGVYFATGYVMLFFTFFRSKLKARSWSVLPKKIRLLERQFN